MLTMARMRDVLHSKLRNRSMKDGVYSLSGDQDTRSGESVQSDPALSVHVASLRCKSIDYVVIYNLYNYIIYITI